MWSAEISVLAQADAGELQATAGQMVSGTLVLLLMGASLALNIVWFLRWQRDGQVLPASQRGLLRVPPLLLIAGLCMAGLILLMVMANSLVPVESLTADGLPASAAATPLGTQDAPDADTIPATAGPAEPVTSLSAESTAADEPRPAESASAESSHTGTVDTANATVDAANSEASVTDDVAADSAADPESADAATAEKKPAGADPAEIRSDLLQILVFDVGLLLIFGLVLVAVSHEGRVWLPHAAAHAQGRPAFPVGYAGGPASGTSASPDLASLLTGDWPDLDGPPAVLFSAGGSVPRQSPAVSPDVPAESASGAEPAAGAADRPDAAELSATAELPAVPELPATAELSAAALSPPTETESWEFWSELRWAAEVFVASYLPTTLLRLIIMALLLLFTGEEAESHPFLEMMEQGVDWEILLLIGLMAVIMAPLVEELFYRVVILGGLAQLHRVRTGLVVSSIVFCFAHGFPDSLALFPLAFALGYTYLRRRSYGTVMLVHFLFNGFNLLVAGLAMLS